MQLFFLFLPNEQKPADETRLGRISKWTNNIAVLLCCAIFFTLPLPRRFNPVCRRSATIGCKHARGWHAGRDLPTTAHRRRRRRTWTHACVRFARSLTRVRPPSCSRARVGEARARAPFTRRLSAVVGFPPPEWLTHATPGARASGADDRAPWPGPSPGGFPKYCSTPTFINFRLPSIFCI